jgi:hypothetical protein
MKAVAILSCFRNEMCFSVKRQDFQWHCIVEGLVKKSLIGQLYDKLKTKKSGNKVNPRKH